MAYLKIVTFNLRTLYDTYDGVNSFIHRAGMILDKINEEKPHVICFQECSPKIRRFLKNYLVDYDIVGHGRNADYSCESLCAAWRRDVMELYGLEQFWLSPTPSVPGSRFENQSEYPRICTKVIVKHKDIASPIRFFNIHLDHESEEARILGMKLVLKKVSDENSAIDYPTFIMGDFNSQPDSEPISICNNYTAYPMVDLTKDLGATFHDFGGTGHTEYSRGWKIDYIFASSEIAEKVKNVTKWEDNKNGIYLSDHYPVCCELEF